jgi:hypothetical protein
MKDFCAKTCGINLSQLSALQFISNDLIKEMMASAQFKIEAGNFRDAIGLAGFHIPHRSEQTKTGKKIPRHRSRRWVVERTHSWLNNNAYGTCDDFVSFLTN